MQLWFNTLKKQRRWWQGISEILRCTSEGKKLEDICEGVEELCPHQMRSFEIVMDNGPKHSSVNCKSSLSIYIPDLDLRLPLEMDGVITYILHLLLKLIRNLELIHVNLTCSAVWGLHLEMFSLQESIVLKNNQMKC